jgi:uncharacterized phage protein gp47/JayE
MPTTPPQFRSSQGALTTSLVLNTTLEGKTLTGVLDPNTVDVQVSVNGGAFRSDPGLISFEGSTFTLPSPIVFPEGLSLRYGLNTYAIRSVDVTGNFSTVSEARITLLRPSEVSLVSAPPFGLRVRRKSNSVSIVFEKSDLLQVSSYNVYASSESGGGSQGYYKINANPITDVSFQEESLTESDMITSFVDNEYGQLGFKLDQRDFNGGVISDQPLQLRDTSLSGPRLKIDTTISTVEVIDYLEFIHDRSATLEDGVINNEFFASVPEDSPLYYVITSLVYDPITRTEIESTYSSELTGLPLILDSQIQEFPRRTRFDVSETYISKILDFDNEISVIPGSVVRDIFVDPFATEAERLYFIMDFVSRSRSFASLLRLDDNEAYKLSLASALGLTDVSSVQTVIDDAFEKRAFDNGVSRLGTEFSSGEVVFYTTTEPTEDLVIEVGTTVTSDDGIAFRVTATTTLPFVDRLSFYNQSRRRYEITTSVLASSAGSASNLGVGSIRNVLGGAAGLQVTNLEKTQFGREEESNTDLAERSLLAYVSVDAGTPGGYLSTAIRQSKVFRAHVEIAGDDLMMRDYDEVREKHVGGKVDVWVQGDNPVTVTDKFALQFGVERDQFFFLDSNPSDLIFVSDDPRLTPETPLTKMLGANPQELLQGFGFRNITQGVLFDLTGVSIIDYNRIQLNTAIPQPVANPNDRFTGDYRFLENDLFTFTRQPVSQVNNVTSLTNNISLTQGVEYDLYKTEDPLLNGESTLAQDYLDITQVNGIPTGERSQVNAELQVLVGSDPVALENLGVSLLSVRVFSQDRLVEYNGPLDPNPDFFLIAGTSTTSLSLQRNPAGNIPNGLTVSVDYLHDENFEVEYVINDVVSTVQTALDVQRHATGDVIAKVAIPNPIDFELTIVLSKGASQSLVDRLVRNAVSQLLNSLPIGESIHQSDVIRVIENVKGVSYVVVPFAKMTHADGNLILRESISNSFVFLGVNAGVKTYIMSDGLDFSTSDLILGSTTHQGVYQDNQPLTLVRNFNLLDNQINQAYRIGQGGLIIQGYSDDATLTSLLLNTPEERENRRLALTSNRILISLPDNDSPENHTYTVTYPTQGDQTSQSSLNMARVSYAELGDLTMTYQKGGES